MMRSLYSGVSGLKNHQTRMDVIGNNIANVNTIGFKTSRTVFQDIYSQTSRGASAPSDALGGMNPMQIGLGVTLSAIDVLHTASAVQRTDRTLDLAIEGEGFFILGIDGLLNGFTDDLTQPDAQVTDDFHDVAGEFLYSRAGNFYIDANGFLVNSNGYYLLGYDDQAAGMSEGDPDDLQAINVYNYMNVSIDATGQITGINSDGDLEVIGYLALATFSNTAGLEKRGNSLYAESSNSGFPKYNSPAIGPSGALSPGALEMSNVDLSEEFTDMIVTQRGFQANSRIITTSDSMLEELVNLKR